MFRIALFLAMNFVHAQLNLAPCTDDSHCSTGLFCEMSALYCRQCVRCEDYQRESPQEDICVKSLVQCGDCLEGLVAETTNGHDNINAGCMLFTEATEKHHPYLPPYAWVAIAIGLVLMLLTVFVFLKTKMYRDIAYSSRTSVHSLRAAEAAERVAVVPPPPYNYHLPSNFPLGSAATEMPEIRRLVDSPEISLKSSEHPPSRPRETAGSQEARVFNTPAYVRIPQSDTRCSSPEVPVPEVGVAAAPEEYGSTTSHNEPVRDIAKIESDNGGQVLNYSSQESTSGSKQRNRTLACGKVQDSNNNYSPESSRGPKIVGENICGASVLGGTSFVINVVDNISNVQQQNHVNCFHTDPI